MTATSSQHRSLASKTNVRSIVRKTLPSAFSALRWVAPALAEAAAADLFFTPTSPTRKRYSPLPGVSADRLPFDGGHLVVAATGDAPRILLVHGWEGHGGQLTTIAHALRSEGFGVVAFDMPAHGRSTGRQSSLVKFAEAIARVTEAYGPFAGVVAHSMGASAVVLASARGISFPRAVLLAPAAEPSFFAHGMAKLLALPEPVRANALRRIEQRLGGDFERLDARRIASTLTTKALVVHGAGDLVVPIEHGRSLAAHWPGARFHAVEGIGHDRILRSDETVRETLAFFLADHAAPRIAAPMRLLQERV